MGTGGQLKISDEQQREMREKWMNRRREEWRGLKREGIDPIVQDMVGGPLDGCKYVDRRPLPAGHPVGQCATTDKGPIVASYRFDGEVWRFDGLYFPGRGLT